MKVTTRPITIDDAEASWRLRANPNLVWEFMRCEPPLPASLVKERQYIHDVIHHDSRQEMFAILVDDKYVGWVTLKNIANGAAELSYCVMHLDMRGHGVGTEAVRQVIDYGFDALQLDLIYRYVHKDNAPSVAMTLKQKFARVGKSYLNQNVDRYEMTKTGWYSQRKRKK